MTEPQSPLRQAGRGLRQRPPSAFGASWMAWSASPEFQRGLVASAIVGAVLALVGALGMQAVPLWLRLVYWIGLAVGGTVAGTATSHLVLERLGLDERPWLAAGTVTVLLTPPMTLAVWAATGLTFRGRLDPGHLPVYFAPVLLLTLALTALNLLVQRKPVVTHAAPEQEAKAPVRFRQRIPLKLRNARLLAIQAEDHYLRLHTDRGQDLILLRLSDAVMELEGLEGARVHRSWWVARDAVTSARRQDGRATLTLNNGLQVPVSRNFTRALREAGWF